MSAVTDPAALASDVHPALAPWCDAGVVDVGDALAAVELGRLVGERDARVLLATALALRSPRTGHVRVELSAAGRLVGDVHDGARPGSPAGQDAAADPDGTSPSGLHVPDPEDWRAALRASTLVVERPARPHDTLPDPSEDRPLVLVGDALYLERYWRHEQRVAGILRRRAARPADDAPAPARLRGVLDRLAPAGSERPDRQRLAVATAATRALSVVAGGPGTGKTYTIARILAVLAELTPRVRVAVAAPTGKAADRVGQELRAAAAGLVDVAAPETTAALGRLPVTTVHGLLGARPGTVRARYDRHRRLPYDAVVVDESSMVSLTLMARLLVALRPGCRLVLVGDPDQLVSVDAGTVLADLVGPGRGGRRTPLPTPVRDGLVAATGERPSDLGPADDHAPDLAGSLVVLGTVRRYAPGSGIAALAEGVLHGDDDAVVATLAAGHPDVTWHDVPADADGEAGPRLRSLLEPAARALSTAARAGDAAAALAGLLDVRLLTAHRRGPLGATGWDRLLRRWLVATAGVPPGDEWYAGRPTIVTRTDRTVGLRNGDLGVVVPGQDGLQLALVGRDERVAVARLTDVASAHALTIHKAQGSQFRHVVVGLPGTDSRIVSRELLYTAVTRAQEQVTVVGSQEVVRLAVRRAVIRGSGLRELLWEHPS